jgi:N-acetylmuramoyl-L-alanine amidase
MARMPGVPWRPLASNWASQPVLSAHHIVCLHTMVGSLSSAENYFRLEGYGGSESHFGVGHDGTIYQWQDTSRRADANLDGNDRIISIETADMGTGFPSWSGTNVPPWTEAQLDAIARILAWCHTEHGIPLKLIPNSAQSSRGIGYHRQGIDPWRCSSCERWSNGSGKVCPGDRRIAQIPTVIARASTPGDDMTPEQADQLASIFRAVARFEGSGDGSGSIEWRVWNYGRGPSVRTQIGAIEAGVTTLLAQGDLDEAAIGTATAAALAPLLIPHLPTVVVDLDDEDLAQIATAVADEQARRLTP